MNYIKYIQSQDGTRLYTKINDVPYSKGNVIIVHGLAEHLDRYDELTLYLNQHGYTVIRYDQRGHGRSEGQRTFYSRVDEIVEDLTAILEFTKTHYEGKNYLIGHSMGGYTVALFGTKHPNKVDGIITSGALTRYNRKLFGEPDRSEPADTYFKNELGDGVCSDPEVLEKYQQDDLVAREISAGLAYVLLDGVEYLKQHAKAFVEPVLILHGQEDGLVSPQDSLDFYNEIGSKQKSMHVYAGLQHEILNESSYNRSIFREMVDWLDAQ